MSQSHDQPDQVMNSSWDFWEEGSSETLHIKPDFVYDTIAVTRMFLLLTKKRQYVRAESTGQSRQLVQWLKLVK